MLLKGIWQVGRLMAVILFWIAAIFNDNAAPQQAQPTITLNTLYPGASPISGYVTNVDTTKVKVVLYALTDKWYVQCNTAAPYTNIAPNGTWSNCSYPWSVMVALLVDPTKYTPADTEITNPALDANVLAYAQYPPGPASVTLNGFPLGIKLTGDQPSYVFDPGPNHFSNDPSVISVQADGLHMRATKIAGVWWCAEVYLLQSLGYGTYTVQIASDFSHLNLNTVMAPMFIYLNNADAEFDNEYSGVGGLILNPYTAQFVAQPYTTTGNIVHYNQPSVVQFTSQMEWHPDHAVFRTWQGWSATPAASDIIQTWNYTGPNNIPVTGQERVHINTWLLGGNAPTSGVGDEMIIKSFNFDLAGVGAISASPANLTFTANYMGAAPSAQAINVASTVSTVNFTVASDSPWLTTQSSLGVTPFPISTLVAPGTLAPGTYTGNVILAASNTVKIPVTLNITETGSPCDTNQNGAIDVASVQKLVNEALGISSAANDLNHDGIVNVVDMQFVINAVLNQGCAAH